MTNPADPSLFQNEQVPVTGQQVNTASDYSENLSNNFIANYRSEYYKIKPKQYSKKFHYV